VYEKLLLIEEVHSIFLRKHYRINIKLREIEILKYILFANALKPVYLIRIIELELDL
jgi:hypothetical protein